MTNKDEDEARYVATSKGTEAGHRHRWIDNTRIEDAGTRYVCACGATYFEPLLPRDPGPDKLYYVKEG